MNLATAQYIFLGLIVIGVIVLRIYFRRLGRQFDERDRKAKPVATEEGVKEDV